MKAAKKSRYDTGIHHMGMLFALPICVCVEIKGSSSAKHDTLVIGKFPGFRIAGRRGTSSQPVEIPLRVFLGLAPGIDSFPRSLLGSGDMKSLKEIGGATAISFVCAHPIDDNRQFAGGPVQVLRFMVLTYVGARQRL